MKTNKLNKRTMVVVIAIVVASLTAHILTTKMLKNYIAQQFDAEMDQLDRYIAAEYLSQIEGRLLEVQDLYNEQEISEDVLQERLKNIISLGVSTKYLENFQLTIPDTTSNIGEIFEELIAQIENQIHNVEEGKYSE